MKCNCLTGINNKLKEQNIKLVDSLFAFVGLDLQFRMCLPTEWIEKKKGQKKYSPSLFISFCPFCGKKFEKLKGKNE